MPRQTDHFGLKAVLRKVVSIIEENVGYESVGCPKPHEDRDEGSDENVRFLSVHEHVSAFGHARIVTVHSYPGSERSAEVGCVPDMVKVPMREKDELERAWHAAGAFEFSVQLFACVRASRVNQDVTGSGLDQVAVDPPHAKGQRETEDVDVLRHVGLLQTRAVARVA